MNIAKELNKKLIGEGVRYFRKKNKMTNEDVAYSAGVEKPYLSNLENGKVSSINFQKLEKILAVFSEEEDRVITMSDFFIEVNGIPKF